MIIIDRKIKIITSIFTVFFVVLSTLFIFYAPAFVLSASVPQNPASSFLGEIPVGQFICMPNNTFDIQTNFKLSIVHFSINSSIIIVKPKIGRYVLSEENSEINAFDSLEIALNTQKGDGKK